MTKELQLITKELIFDMNNQPFNICHASNVCVLENGDILAAWFAGDAEGSDDVAIWLSRKSKNQWSSPILIAHDTNEPHWNPVIFQKEDGEIILFYKVGREIKKWYTNYRISKDNGETWSNHKELVQGDRGGRGPVRCKVVQLSDGSMIAGASTEEGIWTAFADRSTDGGKTWQLSEPITIDVDYGGEKTVDHSNIAVSEQSFYGRGVIQPTIWESEPGKVHMLLRSTEEKIYRADSDDYGVTWSKAYATNLPNNNSGIDVVKLEDGRLILCSNPVGENWGPRSPITLQISEDNGETWTEAYVLEDTPGEFSYPAIVAKNDELFVSYTYDRKSITVWNFKILNGK